MDFTLILNFILNQVLATDPPPIKHPANPPGQSTLDHIDPSSPPLLVDHTKPSRPSWHGTLAIFKELLELTRRVFDKSYANSRIYQLRGSARSAGRVAVISDGENAIGSEVAVFLAKNGFKVIFNFIKSR